MAMAILNVTLVCRRIMTCNADSRQGANGNWLEDQILYSKVMIESLKWALCNASDKCIRNIDADYEPPNAASIVFQSVFQLQLTRAQPMSVARALFQNFSKGNKVNIRFSGTDD